MKHLLLAASAGAALVACVNVETADAPADAVETAAAETETTIEEVTETVGVCSRALFRCRTANTARYFQRDWLKHGDVP